MTDYELREWRESDASAWLECQRACFGQEHAKNEAEWRYLFESGGHVFESDGQANENGGQISKSSSQTTRGIVAVQGERVLAACVGTNSRVWFAGEERTCVHWVDLMVHPDHRQGLGGQRLHRDVAEAFFARYGRAGGDLMHFGWPIAPARRFGERFLGYQFVREELCLVREVAADDSSGSSRVRQVTRADLAASPEEVRWLWDRCAGEWGLSAIRDAAWLRWRFLDHPKLRYRVLGVREGGVLRGMAVVRETPWHWPGALALCDWLVPAGEPEVAVELEREVQRVAREFGLDRVVALLPPCGGASDWFQTCGWSVHSTPYQWMVRSFDRQLVVPWVHRHGWFTLADTDLA